MKGFVLAFALLAVVASSFAEPPLEMKGMIDDCKTEIGITDDKPPQFDSDDPKAKCLGACVMKKIGKMIDGKIVLSKEMEILSKKVPDFNDAKKAALTECVKQANQQTEECEVAHTLAKCLKERNLMPPFK